MISVALERWPPVIVALGPPVTEAEPLEYLLAMRSGIQSVAELFKLGIESFQEEDDLTTELEFGVTKRLRSMGGLIRHHLRSPLQSTDRRSIMATATALAGGMRFSRRQGRDQCGSKQHPF